MVMSIGFTRNMMCVNANFSRVSLISLLRVIIEEATFPSILICP